MTPYFKLLLKCIQLHGDMQIENISKVKPIQIFNEIMNVVDNNGNTLLFHFVINKEYNIAMLAIELGVDIIVQNNQFKIILDYASENINNVKHIQFIYFLHWCFIENKRGIMMFSFEKVNLTFFFESV